MPENSIDNQAKKVMDSRPEPSPHAIDAEENQREKLREQYAGLTDKHGRAFDPSIHRVDADGQPNVNKRDGFLSIKPGRGTRDAHSGPTQSSVIGKASPPSIHDDSAQQRRAAAAYTVEAIQMVGFAIGGKDWAYKTDTQTGIDERLFGIEAFDKYYLAKNVSDIPPGIAVTLWLIMYASPRVSKSEPTKNRLKAAWYWTLSKFSRKKHDGARADTRNDGERENHAGERA